MRVLIAFLIIIDMALHHSGADKALINMIEMRKQSRKNGLIKAKQRELLIRTRAMDILEVTIQKKYKKTTSISCTFPNEKYKKNQDLF